MRVGTQAVLAVAASVMAAAAVYSWQSSQPETVVAQSLLEVQPGSAAAAGSDMRPQDLVFLARGHAARAQTLPVLEVAADDSGLDVTAEQVRQRLTVDVSNDNGLLLVETTGPTHDDAVALNRAAADALAERVRTEQVQRREARLAPIDAQIAEVEALLGQGGENSPRVAAARTQYQALVTARAEVAVAPLDRIEMLSPPQPQLAGAGPFSGSAMDAALTFVVALAVGLQLMVAGRVRSRRQPAEAEPRTSVPV